MSRKNLTLVVSKRMDTNKKPDRNEDGLVRMSKVARVNMGFEDKVEVYPETDDTQKRISNALLLDIYQAFSSDLKALRESGMSEQELLNVGFVTSKTYARVTGSRAKKKNVWITDDVTDTVIGADPEFLLFDDDGNVVRANNVMGYQGVIGCDGAMAEVRPAPQISPEGLMENIRKIFADKELTKEIRKYRWTAGCYHKDQNRDYPMGGHIHIGNPVKLARMDMDVRSNFFVGFNKVLDELLALPMVKIDGSKLGRARRSECAMGKYGYFGEFRTCNGRLEHRTLSGMWLMHPELSILVFGTAKAIIDEVFSHVAHNKFSRNYLYSDIAGRKDIIWRPGFKDWERIPIVRDMGCLKPSDTMVEILNDSKAEKITMPFLREWYAKMRTLGTYKKYARYIDGLFEVLKIKQKSFDDCNKVIQDNWLNGHKFLK